jgi:hypothetical protein
VISWACTTNGRGDKRIVYDTGRNVKEREYMENPTLWEVFL